MSTNLMQASNQWRSRPADERFLNLVDMQEHFKHIRDNSRAAVISSRGLAVAPVEGSHEGLQAVIRGDDRPLELTHWSFGQICQRAGAPAGYLREIPSELAADCVNYGLHVNRDMADVGVLSYRNGGDPMLRAVTGPAYGRVWNETLTNALVRRFGDGISGNFKVPGEFGRDVVVTKDNTTLYASDRDMFVFLADEKNRIEIPNRRNGESGSLARGFFMWNSEVGDKTFGVATFYFDYACSNRIVWGAEGYSEITVRHTASAPDKWIEQVAPAIEQYANAPTTNIVAAVERAQKAKVEKLDDFLASRFTKKVATAVKAAHMADEQRPIESLWDVATGITAFARSVQQQDERVGLEREAGRILSLAK
jgi:hypothetical protein